MKHIAPNARYGGWSRHFALAGPAALAFVVWCSLISGPGTVFAGGYDLPLSYSARHTGMGGAAVSYVSDPSALFHNPAGLAHVGRASFLAAISLMFGNLQAAPEPDTQTQSDLAVAPLFLLGGSVRITDWLVAGLGVYPVAAAGASYKYMSTSGLTTDRTRALFLEVSPALAVELPANIRIGVGYRVTMMMVDRFKKGAEASQPGIDLTLRGFNFAGLRVGAQWDPLGPATMEVDGPFRLQVGLSYRHKTTVKVKASDGYALSQSVSDVRSAFVLPSRLTAGLRGDFRRLGLAFDFEYGWNSQNANAELQVDLQGSSVTIPNPFAWRNAITLRTGAEYRLLDQGQLAIRAGYVYDEKTASEQYPTPFGPPPDATHMVTAGAGYRGEKWAANIAYGYRFGGTAVTADDLEGAQACAFCGYAGDYGVKMHGLFLDLSYDF